MDLSWNDVLQNYHQSKLQLNHTTETTNGTILDEVEIRKGKLL
jgi:hypothetical protein